jgi:hypothetical protein
MIACRDQAVRSSQREPVERRLRRRAKSAVVDAAGRLMEDGNHRNAEAAGRKRRACERCGDRVEKDGARPDFLRPTKHRCATKSSERKPPFGEREEKDPRLVRRRRVRHPQVVQVAPAQAAGIA